MSDDHSQRLRQLEGLAINLQTRLGAVERMQADLGETLDALRLERRADNGRLFAELELIRREIAVARAIRHALAWVTGLAVALIGAIAGAWVALKGAR